MPDELNGAPRRDPKNRPNERGLLRFDRCFPKLGVPRLQRSSGTSDGLEFHRRNECLSQLAAMGCEEELKAFASGEISIDDIVKAFQNYNVKGFLHDLRVANTASLGRANSGPFLATATVTLPDSQPSVLVPVSPSAHGDPRLARPLWSTAVEEIIPGMGELAAPSRRRYATSIRALQRKLAVYAADDEAFEALADLPGTTWDALGQARMRGVTVERLRELTTLSQPERRMSLRETDTRLSEGVFAVLKTLPRYAWNALGGISKYLVDEELVNALDRLRPDERHALRESARKLGATPCFGDLAQFTKSDWARFSRSWGGSSTDWNHMRRALSAVLTDLLGTSHSEFRRKLMEQIELKAERERVVDLSPEFFWKIVANLPSEANAFPVAIVLTGARISEYERLDRKHLKPRTHVVELPGTKTDGSVRDVHIDRAFWPYIDAAVPAPREYGWLRRKWKEACATLDVYDVTLHDLRHCHGQWALQAGAQEQSVQVTLGHKTPGMTRRYTKSIQKGEVARALGSALRQRRDGDSTW